MNSPLKIALFLPALAAQLAFSQSLPDRVEVKVSVLPAQINRALAALKLKDGDAEKRKIYFYDTPSLELFNKGLILRARVVKDGHDDSTVKLRPVNAAIVNPAWFGLPGFKCEADMTQTSFVNSCSVTAKTRDGQAETALNPDSINALFTANQLQFIEDYSQLKPDFGLLRPLGPVKAKAWETKLPGPGIKAAAELWSLPDGREFLEVSTRTNKANARSAISGIAGYLKTLGISVSPGETKTKFALEYFAAHAH